MTAERAIKSQVITLLLMQYGLGVLYMAAASLWDESTTLSALVGCLAALIPKTYVGLRMLRSSERQDATQWLGYAYRSEIGKWVITGAIFMLAFTTGYPWDPVVLFAGFVLIQLSGLLSPIVINGI